MKVPSLKILIFVFLAAIAGNTAIAQEPAADNLIEIPREKPDTTRTPSEIERKRIPLSIATVRRVPDGRLATHQKLDETEHIPSTGPTEPLLTIQGCQGIAMSKEEAMRSGNVCASARR